MRQMAALVGGLLLLAALVILPQIVIAQAPADKGPVRARPPKFPKSVVDLFSVDARDNLQGERPNFQAAGPAGAVATAGTPTTAPGSGGSSASVPTGPQPWSKLISADALESEIKAYKSDLGEDAKTLGGFKSGGIKKVRKMFTEYAALFAVIVEYDGDVKWKSQAVAARENLARCASNCKAATDGQFQETKRTLEDLDTLIGGGTITGPADADPKNVWPKIAERRFLMQRMENWHQGDLTAWTANAEDFKKNIDKVIREAQLMTVMCEICTKEGYENWNDAKFVEFAKTLQQSCIELGDAAKNKDYDAARKAVGNGAKACANCHSDYRS
ncbi:MAG TPA: hypothetical protein VFE24_12700 [Pirellulales bacterium]|jgi:hypothetical protein|nr:hypothetical protein [Pirellulales bacterium]